MSEQALTPSNATLFTKVSKSVGSLKYVTEIYNPQEIESRWQQRWINDGTYEVDNDDPRPSYYVLSMYPYPSGPAHMGHVRNYTMGDLLVRYRTMRGDGVSVSYTHLTLPTKA